MFTKFLYEFNASARNCGQNRNVINHEKLFTSHRYHLAICIDDLDKLYHLDTLHLYEALAGFVDSSLNGSVFVGHSLKPELNRYLEDVQARVVRLTTNYGVGCPAIARYIHNRVNDIFHANPSWFVDGWHSSATIVFHIELVEDNRILCQTPDDSEEIKQYENTQES